MKQQLLPLSPLKTDATFDQYVSEDPSLLSMIQTWITSASVLSHPDILLIEGPSGSGRTHLLQACAHMMEGESMYVPLRSRHSLSPDVLQGMEYQSLLCFDDVDALDTDSIDDWQQGLFALYNRVQARQAKQRWIVSVCGRTSEMNIALPDLKTRLQTGLPIRLHALTDEQKTHVLKQRARFYGWDCPDAVITALMKYLGRDLKTLLPWLSQLEEEARRRKTSVSVHLFHQLYDAQD